MLTICGNRLEVWSYVLAECSILVVYLLIEQPVAKVVSSTLKPCTGRGSRRSLLGGGSGLSYDRKARHPHRYDFELDDTIQKRTQKRTQRMPGRRDSLPGTLNQSYYGTMFILHIVNLLVLVLFLRGVSVCVCGGVYCRLVQKSGDVEPRIPWSTGDKAVSGSFDAEAGCALTPDVGNNG